MSQVTGLRHRKHALRMVQELDAFPKVPESYQETSATGGGISIIVFVIILILVISEVRYYMTTDFTFDYDVDPEFQGKLQINIDLTVAMKCAHVGADVLDQTGQNADIFGVLSEEDVSFELSPGQKTYFKALHSINAYLREEYHALHKSLWSSSWPDRSTSMPRWDGPLQPVKNGCRFHGSLRVNKVAGNFHITAGKSVPVFPRGHAHLSMMMSSTDYNFSHRILKFSFGDTSTGTLVNPLEGEEKITTDNHHMFQYFLQLVPTRLDTAFSTVTTYQYAATESNRTISHSKGSHGVPGIYIKYDLSSLRVHVRETRQPFWQFIVRLCAIVGGVFATSGLFNLIVGAFVDILCCRLKWQPDGQSSAPNNGSVLRPSLVTMATDHPTHNAVYDGHTPTQQFHLLTDQLPANNHT